MIKSPIERILFLFLTIILSSLAGSMSITPNASLPIKLPKDLGGSGPHTFDYLLGESTNFNSPRDVLFVDYGIEKSKITNILSKGKRVICYVNVGAWEEWRSDAGAFPSSVLGNDYEGWPGERWLDVRKLNILLPIMRARFRVAAEKGCEGIDPDNMNGWSVDTGFPISFDQQLVYNEAIAKEIHAAGMLAGLKNDNEQAWELVDFNDFAVVESCARYEECDTFEAFIWKNKPVFGVEYTEVWDEDDFDNEVCWPLGEETGISFILKDMDLHNDYILPCVWDRSSDSFSRSLQKKPKRRPVTIEKKKKKARRYRRVKPNRSKRHGLN